MCFHVNLSHLQQELELVSGSVEDGVALTPPFPSRAPPLPAEVELEVAVVRGWGTDRFQHSQRTQAGRNLRGWEIRCVIRFKITGPFKCQENFDQTFEMSQ